MIRNSIRSDARSAKENFWYFAFFDTIWYKMFHNHDHSWVKWGGSRGGRNMLRGGENRFAPPPSCATDVTVKCKKNQIPFSLLLLSLVQLIKFFRSMLSNSFKPNWGMTFCWFMMINHRNSVQNSSSLEFLFSYTTVSYRWRGFLKWPPLWPEFVYNFTWKRTEATAIRIRIKCFQNNNFSISLLIEWKNLQA